jgi:hypothetical protein
MRHHGADAPDVLQAEVVVRDIDAARRFGSQTT